MAMNKKLAEFDRMIAVTPDYVSKMASYTGDEEVLGPKPALIPSTSEMYK